jgi:hypothetical protein
MRRLQRAPRRFPSVVTPIERCWTRRLPAENETEALHDAQEMELVLSPARDNVICRAFERSLFLNEQPMNPPSQPQPCNPNACAIDISRTHRDPSATEPH